MDMYGGNSHGHDGVRCVANFYQGHAHGGVRCPENSVTLKKNTIFSKKNLRARFYFDLSHQNSSLMSEVWCTRPVAAIRGAQFLVRTVQFVHKINK